MAGIKGDPEAWRTANRANWDERVGVHLGSKTYDARGLKAGCGRLGPIEEAELGPVAGKRVLHLQCHMGHDTLTLAQRGAEVVGVDFSRPAIGVACDLARELGLSARARFVEADVYDAATVVGEPRAFDLVFTTWGTVGWLPNVRGWADTVVQFLKPGGSVYLADGHPAALVFDDAAARPDGMPGYYAPYFQREPLIIDDPRDYADDNARLANATQYNWMHPLSDIVMSLIDAGLQLEWLHEHRTIPWRMFAVLVQDDAGMFTWPDRPWLPLAFSLRARSR
ncbi:MAG: class I SAM-dependent methyltransferase [Alphaproteobacteria bacterium]|nr:class I SAM-dependent methyltransferase [Alphaproteobacteria bacterium]